MARLDSSDTKGWQTRWYDGDQLTGVVGGNSQTRTYDQERHLVQITSASTTSTFIYDGNDQRIIQNVSTGSTTTRTLYIGSFYEETLTGGSNPPYIVYYMLGSKMVGLRRANQPGVNTNGQFRVVGDQLGSTTLIIDTAPTPNVTQREYYKPFGEVAFTSGSSRTDKGFTGQRLDVSSGLMYYGARYYDPVLSYFISPDTIVPDPSNAVDYNRYFYVRGNPLRFIDALGYGPSDYYLFVFGCVTDKTSHSGGCGPRTQIGEFTDILHAQYEEWRLAREREITRTGEDLEELPSWEVWSKEHIRTVSAEGGFQDVGKIYNALAAIPGKGNIHIWGHSQGGLAVLQYLVAAKAGGDIDPRIASIALVDFAVPFDGIGDIYNPDTIAWVSTHTRIGQRAAQGQKALLQVSADNSIFGHVPCIPGFECYQQEAYYSRGDVPVGSPSNMPNLLDPVRLSWHDWTYRAVNQTAFESWFWRFWR